MKRTLTTALFLMAFVSGDVQACSCNPDEAEHPLEKAEVAFVGRPIKIEVVATETEAPDPWQRLKDSVSRLFGDPPSDERPPRLIFLDSVRLTFEVLEYLKGDGPEHAQIMTGYGGSDCGLPVSISEKYTIYARRSDGELRTSYCFGSGEFVRNRTAPSCSGS